MTDDQAMRRMLSRVWEAVEALELLIDARNEVMRDYTGEGVPERLRPLQGSLRDGTQRLVDAMNELYAKHGYYKNGLLNFAFEGEDGMKTMNRIMDTLRANAPAEIAGYQVSGWSDYEASKRYDGGAESEISLPKSNVLEYRLENGSKVIVRPSGTEPKIKIYLSAKGDGQAASEEIVGKLEAAIKPLLGI